MIATRTIAATTDTPAWITQELIADTIRIGQPYYTQPLTESDAVAMLRSVGNLFSNLSGAASHEKIRRISPSQQSGTGT
jgi:hypothetical protein